MMQCILLSEMPDAVKCMKQAIITLTAWVISVLILKSFSPKALHMRFMLLFCWLCVFFILCGCFAIYYLILTISSFIYFQFNIQDKNTISYFCLFDRFYYCVARCVCVCGLNGLPFTNFLFRTNICMLNHLAFEFKWYLLLLFDC